MSIIAGTAIESALGGYEIDYSLRFNSADDAYLNRTFGTPTNNKKWTYSVWMKRSAFAANQTIMSSNVDGAEYWDMRFNTSDQIYIQNRVGSSNLLVATTTAVFRDPSAWYHIVFVFDSDNATAANRNLLYINGVNYTLSANSGSGNASAWNVNSVQHNIGVSRTLDSSGTIWAEFNGYMTEIHFIDGQALTPTSFGEYNTQTGVWQPIAYSGSYGTNGFYINFSDNSNTTATTLGKDYSGNGNNWTPNQFSVTAGSGNDSLVDVPTLWGTDTGAGGEVRGNYATLNPLTAWRTDKPSNGNLSVSGTSGFFATGTMALPSGKWYCEVKILGGTNEHNIGFVNLNSALMSSFPSTSTIRGSNAFSLYSFDGKFYNNGTASASLATFAANDIVMFAYDADNSKIYVGRNGTWLNSAVPASGTGAVSTTATAPLIVAAQYDSGDATGQEWNFGQRPFAYTAPSGFAALCTTNLPEPTILDGSLYFNVELYTGGSGDTATVSSLTFQPDLVWLKARSSAENNYLQDAVRGFGAYKSLTSNSTGYEGYNGGTPGSQSITFSTNSMTLSSGDFAYNGYTYVEWLWKANGSGVTNNVGTIQSTVSANTTSGFSIVTYTGTNSAGTVGHGLGAAPSMIIVKNRDDATWWDVYVKTLGPTKYLRLNSTSGELSGSPTSIAWNDTAPTSTVFSIGTVNDINANTQDFVAYCFAPVEGYSAFGSYVGTNTTDNAFVYCGFRPRYLLIKCSSTGGTSSFNWVVYDSVRSTYNATTNVLWPSLSALENSSSYSPKDGAAGDGNIDFLSNGFKIRSSASAMGGSNTYIYAAFAENPFKYALAR